MIPSVQAYGSRMQGVEGAWFYPGSGATCDTQEIRLKEDVSKQEGERVGDGQGNGETAPQGQMGIESVPPEGANGHLHKATEKGPEGTENGGAVSSFLSFLFFGAISPDGESDFSESHCQRTEVWNDGRGHCETRCTMH